MEFSPLFWPVSLDGQIIRVLDETVLPEDQRYLEVKDYQQACQAIKDMKTRAVGQVLLVFYTFLLVLEQQKNKQDILATLQVVADALNSSRPTLSFRFLTDMVLGWAKQGLPLDKTIRGFLEQLKAARIKQAETASGLLANNDCILTHCNISGQMPLIAQFCRQHGKTITFFVTETRPYWQGVRLTAWELQQAGFDVTVISDSMVAQVMREGKISKVLVGADNLAQNGDIANKIGTYQIAILAHKFGIPFYVLCPPASKAKTGEDITIEVRPESELFNVCGKSIAPPGVKGYYPAFDITPRELITELIYLPVGR